MEITDSARKHGIPDADIHHATTHAIRALFQHDRWLYIGPDRTGRLLEIIVLDQPDTEPAAIHAMPLRPKFHRHL